MVKIRKSGWLQKIGARGAIGKRKRKRRFFVQEDMYLRYYDKDIEENNAGLKGSIDLLDIQKVVIDPLVDTFCFKLECQGRTYTLIAANNKELNGWIDSIQDGKVAAADVQAAHSEETGKSAFTIEKEGWLEKRRVAMFQKLKKRWFTLNQMKLAYYENPTDKIALNSLSVSDFKVNQDSTKNDSFTFFIETPRDKYELVAESEAEMKSWLFILKKVKQTEEVRARRATTRTQNSNIVAAAREKDFGQVKYFLDKGEDPNTEVLGMTALHVCAQTGLADLASELIKYGADTTRMSKVGTTPLHIAAQKGSIEIVKLLLKSQVDVNQLTKNEEGFTPLHLAATQNRTDVVKIFLDAKANINAKNSKGRTPFCSAVISRHEESMRLLFDRNADPNIGDNEGKTPLHHAILNNYEDIAIFLIQKGVDIHAADNKGNTPLHAVAEVNSENIVRELLKDKRGFDEDFVDVKNKDGATPLHVSIASSSNLVTDCLLTSCANLNAATNKGVTPLHLALEKVNDEKNFKLAVFLVESKVNLNCQNDKGLTPLLIAINQRNDNMVARLLDHGADTNAGSAELKMTPLHMAAYLSLEQSVSHLLVNGARVNEVDRKGWTPLHYAAFSGSEEIVKVLVGKHAEPNKRDNKGVTPLHCAWKKDNKNVAYFLVNKGAVVSKVEEGGHSESLSPTDITPPAVSFVPVSSTPPLHIPSPQTIPPYQLPATPPITSPITTDITTPIAPQSKSVNTRKVPSNRPQISRDIEQMEEMPCKTVIIKPKKKEVEEYSSDSDSTSESDSDSSDSSYSSSSSSEKEQRNKVQVEKKVVEAPSDSVSRPAKTSNLPPPKLRNQRLPSPSFARKASRPPPAIIEEKDLEETEKAAVAPKPRRRAPPPRQRISIPTRSGHS